MEDTKTEFTLEEQFVNLERWMFGLMAFGAIAIGILLFEVSELNEIHQQKSPKQELQANSHISLTLN